MLQDEGLPPSRATDSRWRNLVSFYRRLESDEVPHARVRARFKGRTTEVVADGEGYFQLDLRPSRPLRGGAWHDVALSLIEPAAPVYANGRVLVPAAGARFGVISDIDDTVVVSGVTRRLAMVVRLALSNARTRKPFAGVAAFYRALHADRNPVFYVSKSPWNIYEPLVQFLEAQGLPLGPLLLRDYSGGTLLGAGRDHKRAAIERILTTYPRLPFVLIGDSAESDPEIYAEVVRRHPDRVRCVYIRSVRLETARVTAIERLTADLAPTGCQLVLAPDSELAAAHAAAEGLIPAAALRAVRADRKRDAR